MEIFGTLFGPPDIKTMKQGHDIPGLMKALNHPDRSIRHDAAIALGELGQSERATQILITLLKEGIAAAKGEMMIAISSAVGRGGLIYGPGVSAAMDRAGQPQKRQIDQAMEALVDIGEMAVAPLIDMMDDPDVGEAQGYLVGILSKIGPPAIEPLITVLNNAQASLWAKSNAATILGNIGDIRALEPLCAALKDGRFVIRDSAIRALQKLKDPRVVKPLISVLSDDQIHDGQFISQLAMDALVDLRDLSMEALSEAALNNENEKVRVMATKALMAIGGLAMERAVEPLIAALKHEHTAKWAIDALGQIKDSRAVEPLISALADDDEYVRLGAARALGAMENPRAIQPLVNSLGDQFVEVQEIAAEALRKIGDPRAVDYFISALRHADASVRCHAAEALGKSKDARALEPLIASLRDGRVNVRRMTAQALGQIKSERAIPPLIAAINDENPFVRRDAVEALVQITGNSLGNDQTSWQKWWDQKNE